MFGIFRRRSKNPLESAVFCGKCGANLPRGSQFCLKCGQPVEAPANSALGVAASSCSQCGANLPEGSQFCLKCGQAVQLLGPSAAAGTEPALAFCAECGAEFPARGQFCPMCGQSVQALPKGPPAEVETAVRAPSQAAAPKLPKSTIAIWLLLPALALAIWWTAASDNPAALQLRRLADKSHIQTITPAVFSVKPRGFASYEFTVPSG